MLDGARIGTRLRVCVGLAVTVGVAVHVTVPLGVVVGGKTVRVRTVGLLVFVGVGVWYVRRTVEVSVMIPTVMITTRPVNMARPVVHLGRRVRRLRSPLVGGSVGGSPDGMKTGRLS